MGSCSYSNNEPENAMHLMFGHGMEILDRAPSNECAGLYFHTGITIVNSGEEKGSAPVCDWTLLMTVGTNGNCSRAVSGEEGDGRKVLMTGIGSGQSECRLPERKDFIITMVAKGENYHDIFQ